MSNSLVSLAREVLEIESDIQFRIKGRYEFRHTVDDFELVTFNQTWGSTALGFGGIGGQAITQARTFVFIPQVDNEDCIVYFGGRYAYSVPYSNAFMDDVHKGALETVSRKGKYLKEEANDGNK